jgi:hypothetical protein
VSGAAARPDYVKCILVADITAQDPATRHAWCGAKLTQFDWHFQSIDHAVMAAQQGSYQLPCPACATTIKEILK